ncbi:MAG: PQQ-binding-like beta-propeller repeat protein, partial [Chromatiales bacterium]|nr:PQQ-binding-like beta-propeller repeat protein [Chromatiales bacterium]
MKKLIIFPALIAILTACGAPKVDMYRAGPSLVGVYDSRGVHQIKNLSWKFNSKKSIKTSPTISEKSIYFGNKNGYLYAIDLESGRERWRFKTGGMISGAPAIYEKVAYVGSHDGHFYAINTENGQEVWKARVSGAVTTSPALVN